MLKGERSSEAGPKKGKVSPIQSSGAAGAEPPELGVQRAVVK